MKNIEIPVKHIYISDSLRNRGSIDEIIETESFVTLRSSILSTGGVINPIVVKKDEDGDKWRVLSGQRRFLATKSIYELEGDKRFETIRASVSKEESGELEEYILSRHENTFRSNISSSQNIEFVLGAIPFCFGLGKKGKERENIQLGLKISDLLRRATMIGSSSKKVLEVMKELEEATNSKNPIERMDLFFESGAIRQTTFLRSIKVTSYREDIRALYEKDKIFLPTATRLEKLINNPFCKSEAEDLISELSKKDIGKREGMARAYSISTKQKGSKKDELSAEKRVMVDMLSAGLSEQAEARIVNLFLKIEDIIKKEGKK